jgi:hypothetical protein
MGVGEGDGGTFESGRSNPGAIHSTTALAAPRRFAATSRLIDEREVRSCAGSRQKRA